MSLQVRIRNFDGTGAIILDKARNKSIFKALNSADEGVSFSIDKNDIKAATLNPDLSGYLLFWEVWDTKKNIRKNYGPITTITEGETEWKVEGRGRSSLLDDFSGSNKSFYTPILELVEMFRLENFAIEPRTSTLVHDTVDSAANDTVFGVVTVNEKYHGISKGTKDASIDDDPGLIRPGEVEPPNTYYTSDSFWAGMSKKDTLIIDLGDNYDVTKISIIFPWWGGIQRLANRAFDYTLDYATDFEAPLTTVQNRDFGPFHQLYDTGTGNRQVAVGSEFIIGTDNVNTAVHTPTYFVAQDQSGPILARYLRIRIKNVIAWFGNTFDGEASQDLWDYQCNPNYSGPKTQPTPPMKGKTISETVVGPANDCYASVVEVGAFKPIIDRDIVKELVLQRVDNNNLQLKYFHTPAAAETTTTSSGFRKFEPGSFFRRYTVTYSGATGGPYTKFYDSDCSNCYPDPFRFGVVDQNNSLILARDETSGSFSRRIGNETKHLLMKGASNATVTYCDAWPANSDVFSWGGSYSYTEIAGDYVTAHFRGQSFKWYATIPEDKTGAQVSIEIRSILPDNTWSAYTTLVANLPLPNNIYSSPVYAITYESGILNYDTTYEIKITNLDGGFVSVDSIEGYWAGSFTQYNEDSTRIIVNNPNKITQIYDQRFSGGSLFKWNAQLTRVGFNFEGDRVIIYSARGRNHGQISIQLFDRSGGTFYDPGSLGGTIPIPGGDPDDGSVTISLDTGKGGNEFAQAIVFDSDDYFPNGLPWNKYSIYAGLQFAEEYTARNADITSTSFMERCKDCKTDSGATSVINKYIYLDGIATHEKTGLSVSFQNQTNLERLKSVVEVIQGEWDVNDIGLHVEPRIGVDTNILLREGTNTLVEWEIVNDISNVATMLVSEGADIDGLPLFTITEDKKNRNFMGRTIMRTQDFREVADYETLIGLSRGELKKRKKPEKRITVSHVTKNYLDLNVGDSFLLYTKKMGRIRVRITREQITESNGFLYALDCIVWDRDDDIFYIQNVTPIFETDPDAPDPNIPPDPEPPPPIIPPPPTPPPPDTGGGGSGDGGGGTDGGGGSGGSSGTGNSITINANTSELYSAMANSNLDEIIIRDGSMGHLDITASRISRTASKPLYIRAQNRWGVKISGWSGEGISINNGACYFTLDGFEFESADAEQGGCIVFGTEGNQSYVGAHHIDLLNMKIGSTVTGPGSAGSTANSTAHGLYIGAAAGGGHHHIVADGWVVQNNFAGLAAAFHMYHSSSGRPNGHDIVFKNAVIDRVTQAIIIWDSTIYNTTVGPNVRITNCNPTAVRHEYGSVLLDDVVSTGSGSEPLVNHGSGMTINSNCSFA